MKQKLKSWIDKHPGEVALVVCLLIGIPLGIWLGRFCYHTLDEPWAVSHRSLCGHKVAFFLLILTLWLILCHCALCVKNRRDPRNYFTKQFKSLKQ